MSQLAPIRSFSRNAKFRIGDKTVTPTRNTFVNVDNPRVQRDLARHSAIGQILSVGLGYWQADDGIVQQGGKVTVRATGLVLDVGQTNYTTAAGVVRTAAAGTATIGTADATNPRIDIVALNTSTDAIVVIAGTATAGANSVNRTGMAVLPANRVALAIVRVDPTVTSLPQDRIHDVRP